MTKPEWLRVVETLNDLWPRQRMPSSMARRGFLLLGEFEASRVRDAVTVLVRRGLEFPPSLSQIYAAASEQASDQLTWGETWDEVMDAIAHYGHYRKPEDIPWSSALVKHLVETSGWQELCLADIKDIPIIQAQWREKWNALRRREQSQNAITLFHRPALGET